MTMSKHFGNEYKLSFILRTVLIFQYLQKLKLANLKNKLMPIKVNPIKYCNAMSRFMHLGLICLNVI